MEGREGKGTEGKGRRVPPLDLNPGDATGHYYMEVAAYRAALHAMRTGPEPEISTFHQLYVSISPAWRNHIDCI